jgi:hypothetical protein
MEAIVQPMRWRQFPPGFRLGFRLMRAPLVGKLMVQGLNIFIEKILPEAVVRQLDEEEMVAWCRKRLPNLDTVDIGEGIHFIQEDNPHGIGDAIAEWYGRI